MPMVRKTKFGKKKLDINYSFINATLEQYTPETLEYMQASRFLLNIASRKYNKYRVKVCII